MGYDRRVAYTKRMIKEALFELIAESDVSEITIKEICAKADINRATFYRHYQDIYDLYLQVTEELSEPTLTKNRDNESFLEALPEQLELTKSHQAFFRSSYRNGIGAVVARQNIEENRERYVQHEVERGIDPVEARIIFDFVQAGITNIIHEWVEAGCKEPIDQMVSIIRGITTRAYGD
ncbi:TetR/AcrR family transcriptional regulator [Slackia heliotrinireducens]|uniref:TetR/AcrR family transcriptional regulator n=1 Tax=Slackia heliotrinireducens TaxID=84110 RepID=UPI003315B14C